MIKINSDNIDEVNYEDGILYVVFKNERTYSYQNVPESVFLELLSSTFPGEYFNDHIKNNYPYKRIG